MDNIQYAYFIGAEGEVIYLEDTTRLDNAPFYKRWLAKISKNYRNTLVDKKPIPIEPNLMAVFEFMNEEE